MKTLLELRECMGKTIERAFESGTDDVLLFFTDDTYCHFHSEGNDDGGSEIYDVKNAGLSLILLGGLHSVAAGVETAEESEARQKAARARWEAESQERKRAEYEKLKKEFGE